MGRIEMSYVNSHEKARKSIEIFMTMLIRKCHKDIAQDATFHDSKAQERQKEMTGMTRGIAFASAYNRLGVSRREYRVAKTTGSVRAFSIHPAMRLRQSWILCDRLSRELDASEKRVGDSWGRLRGQGMDRIFPSWKKRGEERLHANAAPWRFWGVGVERPVKNVIKMCLELPRGKDVMNIKRALEKHVMPLSISIYAQVRKQPRICCREIDSPQKQEGFIQAQLPSFLIFSRIKIIIHIFVERVL